MPRSPQGVQCPCWECVCLKDDHASTERIGWKEKYFDWQQGVIYDEGRPAFQKFWSSSQHMWGAIRSIDSSGPGIRVFVYLRACVHVSTEMSLCTLVWVPVYQWTGKCAIVSCTGVYFQVSAYSRVSIYWVCDPMYSYICDIGEGNMYRQLVCLVLYS